MEEKTISEITRIWGRALEEIKSSLNDELSFRSFFADSYADSLNGNHLIIMVNSPLSKNIINIRYKEIVQNAVLTVTQTNFLVDFICSDDVKDTEVPHDLIVEKVASFFKDSKLNPNFTFENFVMGESNKFAYQAALMCARSPGQIYSPLLIYSQSGLGKTHILNAMGNAMLSLNSKMKVLYISAEEFIQEYVNLVNGHREDQTMISYFRNDVDALLVDDIQLLTGRSGTMEMFFIVFDILFKQGKQIVITSDQPPEKLSKFDERLKSRFASGLVLEIKQPDVSTSIEILKTKIELNNLSVSTFDPAVLEYLATKFSNNVRELEGALNRLVFYSITMKESSFITLDLAKESLEGLVVSKESLKTLDEDKIISTVADYYNLTPSQIKGKIRTSQIALARHISMYLIHSLLNLSTVKIGKIFGGKDHSSVISAIKKIEKSIQEDPFMKQAIDELTTKLKK